MVPPYLLHLILASSCHVALAASLPSSEPSGKSSEECCTSDGYSGFFWIAGGSSLRMKYLEVRSTGPTPPLDELALFEGINSHEVTDNRQFQKATYFSNDFNEIQVAGGAEIRRVDGTVARVQMHRSPNLWLFKMFVWPFL